MRRGEHEMEPAGTGGGGPHRGYPIRLLSFPLRLGLWVGFGLRPCPVCFPSREQEIRRPPAALLVSEVFSLFFIEYYSIEDTVVFFSYTVFGSFFKKLCFQNCSFD